jgi:hypothetical protein
MEFYILNWIQLSYDFGKVISHDTTQGKVCCDRLNANVYVISKIFNQFNWDVNTL